MTEIVLGKKKKKKKDGTVLLCFNLFLLYLGYKSVLDEQKMHVLWSQFSDA